MRTLEQATTSLEAILAEVAKGETVEIRRGAKAVARVVPIAAQRDPEDIRRAVAAIRKARVGCRLDGLKIKDLINEGRP